MQTTDVKKLIINRLTKEQYEAAKEAGTINENELYMTPSDQGELTPGYGITIVDNTVAVNTEVIADVDYVDANITDTMNFIIQERDTERAARIAGDNLLQDDIDAITAKIPAQATSTNQLADKDFVNSSIATNTAHYISNDGQPFTSVAQLEAYTGTVTNNDYAFVTGTDEQGNTYFDRYKATVNGTTVSWAKEYRLNNSSFTAVQWAAINSGITGTLVTKLNNIPTLTPRTEIWEKLDGTTEEVTYYVAQGGIPSAAGEEF